MQTGLSAIIECILVVDLTTENIELSLQYVPRVFPCRALINKQKSGCAIMKGNISGADPGIFDWRSPNFGSERTVELFCGKLLLTETTTCFSICERRSSLAREILLREQRRTDHRRVPKNNHIFENSWN